MSFTEPEFDWDSVTVIREQPRTAVYLNPHDEIVIRSKFPKFCFVKETHTDEN